MEQNKKINIARFIVEKTNCNLFVTGKAGTGKTTFLKDVNSYTKKKHVVLAPTGIAAVNAGAMTIHSFFQFSFGPYIKGVTKRDNEYRMRKSKLDLIRNLELIIIDEISMVRADLLDHINDKLQSIRDNHEPFGGVQLLMIGDLRQLPPIVMNDEMELLYKHYDSMYFFESKALRNSDYYCIELENVYRQTDHHFIEILNRVRTGVFNNTDLYELNSHYVADFTPTRGEKYIKLVTHNRMADIINQEEMDALPKRSFEFNGTVTGNFPEDSYPTQMKLVIKQGAQVMFIKNDPERRFINGTLGQVVSVFNDSIRIKISGYDDLIELEPATWYNIRYSLDEKTQQIETNIIGSFTQYPIKLAWAITVHKSQGLTFDKAVIDIHEAFAPGQAYVALSRCRSLDGLILSHRLTRRAIITDSIVEEYMKGAITDILKLARLIEYEPFDYERDLKEDGFIKGKNSKNSVSVFNQNVFDALKEWRSRVASEGSIPTYVVMNDMTMKELSNSLPEKISELRTIYGLGPKRIEKYGQEILDIIRRSMSNTNDHNSRVVIETIKRMPLHTRDDERNVTKKGKTWAISYEMYKKGKNVKEIAEERSLTENTILGHLARYVETGDLDIHDLVSNDIFYKIERYMCGRTLEDVLLKEVYEYFNETITYGDIRLVLTYLRRALS